MAEESNRNERPSYEQLAEYANQLSKQLNDQRLAEIVAQLNFLFKVVEFKDAFPAAYVEQCVNEIQKVLIIKSDDEPVDSEPEKAPKKTSKKSK